MSLAEIMQSLSGACSKLSFAAPVTHVYNPLDYAWAPQAEYLRRFGGATGRVVMLGMNPGPYGMVQTGVPFGEVHMVRDWMGINEPVAAPALEHPKRPVMGFDCGRTEVSGKRLWGWAAQRYGTAETFFDRYFVLNYCPLVFMEDTGRNRTPDKLPKNERGALNAICDRALRESLKVLKPRLLIGIGHFAYDKLDSVRDPDGPPLILAPHPSPASPVANRGWAPLMDQVVDDAGIDDGAGNGS